MEEKGRRKNRLRERESILQTFYHKNMFKNTLNFKINFIVKLYDIFEKNSCPNCLAYIFWSFKDFWSFGIWYSDIFATIFIDFLFPL